MFKNNGEKGQTIILVVISVLIMVVMAALVVDGGNLYLKRRQAQTAADAAALAVAYEKCVKNVDNFDALNLTANDYATLQNDADSATLEILPPDSDYPMGRARVVTTINVSTLFAKIFTPVVDVRADASASCFFPSTANHILPIAWTCRERDGGSTGECILKSIPHTTWEQIVTDLGQDWFSQKPVPITNPIHILDAGGTTSTSYYDDLYGTAIPAQPKLLYVLMDANSFDSSLCEENGGTINCDFDDDGVFDVEGGADRGWLSLDGTGGNVLSDIMLNGYPGVLKLPQWFPAKDGTDAAVFDTAEEIKFQIKLVPVYNAICEDTTKPDLPTQCSTDYVADPPDTIRDYSGSQTFYRVPGVSAFVITCVSKNNSNNQYCPGRDFAGVYDEPSLSNTKSIEGYFIEGFTADGGATNSGFDLGVYILSLTE